jgi:hypothetical protein
MIIGILNFTYISHTFIYIYMSPCFLHTSTARSYFLDFSTARSYILSLIKYFLHHRIYFTALQFYTFMFHKRTPVLTFLRFTYNYTNTSLFLFFIFSFIKYNIIFCHQSDQTIIFHTTLFDLTFRDYILWHKIITRTPISWFSLPISKL